MTKTQLGKDKLKPGGPTRATIEYKVRKRLRSYDLYDRNEAIKVEATPQQLAALEQARIKQRTCKQCGQVVEHVRDLSPRGRCPVCLAKLHERKRAKEVDVTIVWARRMLATPGALILDTETTSLHGRICELALVKMDGTIVFDRLINPQKEQEATDIHGITQEMTALAPTFADIEPELRQVLHGRTVVVYNAEYDSYVLKNEIERMCTPPDEALAWLVEWLLRPTWDEPVLKSYKTAVYGYRDVVSEHARWWRDRISWECAMLQYSTFVGDWSDYHGNYSYQGLGGGHRAAGDCLACLEVIKRMAVTPLSTEKTDDPTT